MFYIYWIKKKEHINIYKEGYIGVSNSPERRLLEHSINESVVGNNIRKYKDDVEMVVVFSFNKKKDALLKEKELRPKKKIGWNIAIGGQTPPEIKDSIETHKKISQTLKSKGANPYSEKTHSKETIEKSVKTKLKKRYRWYYNENTLETKLFATSEEEIPNEWRVGKKPKNKTKPKIRGIDYGCNVKTWFIYKNGELFDTVENLKEWCKFFGIPYIAQSRRKQVRKLSYYKKTSLSISENNTVIENDTDTGLIRKEYAKKIGISESSVSGMVKRGFYEIKKHDVYTCIEEKDEKL